MAIAVQVVKEQNNENKKTVLVAKAPEDAKALNKNDLKGTKDSSTPSTKDATPSSTSSTPSSISSTKSSSTPSSTSSTTPASTKDTTPSSTKSSSTPSSTSSSTPASTSSTTTTTTKSTTTTTTTTTTSPKMVKITIKVETKAGVEVVPVTTKEVASDKITKLPTINLPAGYKLDSVLENGSTLGNPGTTGISINPNSKDMTITYIVSKQTAKGTVTVKMPDGKDVVKTTEGSVGTKLNMPTIPNGYHVASVTVNGKATGTTITTTLPTGGITEVITLAKNSTDTTPSSVKVNISIVDGTTTIKTLPEQTVKSVSELNLGSVTMPKGYKIAYMTVNGKKESMGSFTAPKDLSKGLNIVFHVTKDSTKSTSTSTGSTTSTTPKEVPVKVEIVNAKTGAIISTKTYNESTSKDINLPVVQLPAGSKLVKKSLNGVVFTGNSPKLPTDLTKGLTFVYSVDMPSTTGITPSKDGNKGTTPSKDGNKGTTPSKDGNKGTTGTTPSKGTTPIKNGSSNTGSQSTSTPNGVKPSTSGSKTTPSTSGSKTTDKTPSTSGSKTTDKTPSTSGSKTTDKKPANPGTEKNPTNGDNPGAGKSTKELSVAYQTENGKILASGESSAVTNNRFIAPDVKLPAGYEIVGETINGKSVTISTSLPINSNVNTKVVYTIVKVDEGKQTTVKNTKDLGQLGIPKAVSQQITNDKGTDISVKGYNKIVIKVGQVAPKGYIPVSQKGDMVTYEAPTTTITYKPAKGTKLPEGVKENKDDTVTITVKNPATPIQVQNETPATKPNTDKHETSDKDKDKNSTVVVKVIANGTVSIYTHTYSGEVGGNLDITPVTYNGYSLVNMTVNGKVVTALPTKFGSGTTEIVYHVANKKEKIVISLVGPSGKVIGTQTVEGLIGSNIPATSIQAPKGYRVSTIIQNGKVVNGLTVGTKEGTAQVNVIPTSESTVTVSFVNSNGDTICNPYVVVGKIGSPLKLGTNILPVGYVVKAIYVNGKAVDSVPSDFSQGNTAIKIVMAKLNSSNDKNTSSTSNGKDTSSTSKDKNGSTSSSTNSSSTSSNTNSSSTSSNSGSTWNGQPEDGSGISTTEPTSSTSSNKGSSTSTTTTTTQGKGNSTSSTTTTQGTEGTTNSTTSAPTSSTTTEGTMGGSSSTQSNSPLTVSGMNTSGSQSTSWDGQGSDSSVGSMGSSSSVGSMGSSSTEGSMGGNSSIGSMGGNSNSTVGLQHTGLSSTSNNRESEAMIALTGLASFVALAGMIILKKK